MTENKTPEPIESWERPEGVVGEVLVTWADGSTTLMGASVKVWKRWDKRLSAEEMKDITKP